VRHNLNPLCLQVHPSLPRAVSLIDLDNCVSEDKWRWPLFELHLEKPNDRYVKYHDACESDPHRNNDILRNFARDSDLIVFTSRPEAVRVKTQRWLNRWRIPVIGIFMRPDDNQDPSVILKRKFYEALPRHYNVLRAIDDREDILNMYDFFGIPTQQVIIHQPEVAHP
jgi:hypothetical protein